MEQRPTEKTSCVYRPASEDFSTDVTSTGVDVTAGRRTVTDETSVTENSHYGPVESAPTD